MGPKWQSESKEEELQRIIQKLTTTGKKTLDEGEMTKLKKICKKSDAHVNCAYHSLMTQLRKDHAEIRYSALLIINELVMRSYVFRTKLEADLEEFLELVEETDPEKPLPLPLPVAKDLKIKGLEFIKAWSTKFGEKHVRLNLALNFLKNCKKMDFNDMEARNSVQRQRQQEEQRHHERMNERLVNKIKNELLDSSEEISNIATQMENCFRLLIPHAADNLFTADDFEPSKNSILNQSETNKSDSGSEIKLRDHGIYDMKKTITIELEKNSEIAVHSNEDTAPIIENLKGLEKQVTRKWYPNVTKWLKLLSKCNNCSDLVKQLIDLKLLMEEKLEKCKELKIKQSEDKLESDEDDDFEEVKDKEGYEETVKAPLKAPVSPKLSCSKATSHADTSNQWRMKYTHEDVKDPTTVLSNISKRFKNSQQILSEDKDDSASQDKKEIKNFKKAELLEKAPVLPYDIDLYHWEEEKPLIPGVVRFDSLHKFWETKDDIDDEENEILKEVQRASLRTRKIDFSGKFEPVKWSCRVPLPNGKLCPRKDRYKCPFHGKIIPRDATGQPSGDPGSIPGPSNENLNSVPDWQDPQLLNDIKAATGIDLKMPEKKSKGKKRKKDGLTNLKQINNTVRQRLAKKIIKRYRHYAPKLDEMERKRFNDKFGDQWNYY